MKKTVGAILIGLGVVFSAVSTVNARHAPNLSHLIGTFLPGLLFLILGLALRREKPPAVSPSAGENGLESTKGIDLRSDRFKATANLGVGCGFVAMLVGGGLAQQSQDLLLVATTVSLAGWAILLWGCVNYVRWKGYSGWLGLFGYLLLPGLIVLACLRNRRVRILEESGPDRATQSEELWTRDQHSGWRFLPTLVPLALLFVGFNLFLASSQSSIDAAEWKEVDSAGNGFMALMPGTPRLEQMTQETPAGDVRLCKFTVTPQGERELFMIVATRFPEDVGRELGGREGLLELGRQDVLSASQGQLKSEKQIVLDGCPGLELEVLPPKGAIIRSRVYATESQLYQISVHVPLIRLPSEDVRRFFDSFRLSAEPDAAADGGGI